MSKLTKRVAVLFLTGAIVVSSAAMAFAAGSPTAGKTTVDEGVAKVTVDTAKDGTADVTGVTPENKKTSVVVNATVKDANGASYTVTTVKTSTLTMPCKAVTFNVNGGTKFEKQVVKKGVKIKQINIKSADGTTFTAKDFNKKAFKGFKGKIKVAKNAMSKKQFNKLAKQLKKGGFKGKISRG